jgi:hypothetical protein
MVAVSSALEVKVDQVVAGNEAVVSDGSVFVELPHFDHAACPTVPRADGIFFLDDRGDARITATHVQGFLLGGADGKLVSVWESFEAMPPALARSRLGGRVLAELAKPPAPRPGAAPRDRTGAARPLPHSQVREPGCGWRG